MAKDVERRNQDHLMAVHCVLGQEPSGAQRGQFWVQGCYKVILLHSTTAERLEEGYRVRWWCGERECIVRKQQRPLEKEIGML